MLKDPQSAALVPKWKQQPGMLGIRVTFLGAAAPWLTGGTADWFWPAAEKADASHFTEELPFLNEQDKDWIMGRAILARLNWT